MADGMAVRRIATALLWDVDAAADGFRRRPAVPEPTRPPRPRRHPAIVGGDRARARAGVPRSTLARRVGSSRRRGVRVAELTAIGGLRDAFGTHLTVNDIVLGATRRRPAPLAAGAGRAAAPDAREGAGEPASRGRAAATRSATTTRSSSSTSRWPRPDPVTRLLAVARECTLRKAATTRWSSAPSCTSAVGRGALVDEPARVHAQRLQRPRPARAPSPRSAGPSSGLRARGGGRLARLAGRRLPPREGC
jgi:hypothetical protein